MRITPNDDLAARLQRFAHDTHRSLDLVTHETLRAGLERAEQRMMAPAFRVEPVSLIALRAGSDADCVSAWLKLTEGPMHR